MPTLQPSEIVVMLLLTLSFMAVCNEWFRH